MTVLRGAGVGRGAVVGTVARAHPAPTVDASAPAETDRAAAVAAVEQAFATVAEVLEARAERSSGTVANVLTATAAMARDAELTEQVALRIDAGQSAPFAVDRAVAEFVDLFTQAGGYLAERVTDLLSVRDRVVALLTGRPEPGVPALAEPAVVVADDLSPADTAALELDKVLAIVIERGGPTGHTAIIAGQLGIPCVVRVVGASALTDGTTVAVDAAAGTVTVDPDDDVRSRVEVRRRGLASLAERTDPGRTADGHAVALLANIGTADDAERAAKTAVEGVGLFRTEVLYLGRTTAPSEDEQVEQYARALRGLEGRKVVIRTLDAGADKPLAFVTRDGQENPALGVRGFRLVRTAAELLRTQLRAIARAAEATAGEPWVMAPMVATVEETEYFVGIARDYGIKTAGVMVEVPSSALLADRVLAHADFASIGTNDLTQYTMAADRLLGSVASFQDPWHPAVLRLIREVGDAGRMHRKPVGICGEAAADPLLAVVLVGLGATSLSMAPTALADVRASLLQHSIDDARVIAGAALAASDAASARDAARAAAAQNSTALAHQPGLN
jgi:phosphotransferase system enzyme I (PtsI)